MSVNAEAVKQAPILNSTANPSIDPTPANDADYGKVCIANISTAERRKRLVNAIVSFVVALVILVVLEVTGVSRWWRLPLFLLFASASVGYYQYADKTCVALAAKNVRKLGDSEEKIEDASELAQIRLQSRRVMIKGILGGIVLTVIALLLPLLAQ